MNINTNGYKVCLTTFVYGETYQDYIPLLIYSIKRAYPEYYPIIFVYGKLKQIILQQLRLLERLGRFDVIENYYPDISPNQINAEKSMAIRWILMDNRFYEYDYLYIVDIDIMYFKEPVMLHIQHIRHMKYIGLPFSNIIRRRKIYNRNIYDIIYRIKKAGLKGFGTFLKNNTYENQLSGLHFIKIKEYYSKLDESKIRYYKNMIINNSYYDKIMNPGPPSNEAFLYYMLKELGYDLSKLGYQNTNEMMLDYNYPERKEFRPHHGIHLGIFRKDILSETSVTILTSDAYMYYVDELKKMIYEPIFIELSKYFGANQRMQFNRMIRFYKISNVPIDNE